MKLEEIPERLLKVNEALKPVGVNISTDYEINIQQKADSVDIKSISITLYLDEVE